MFKEREGGREAGRNSFPGRGPGHRALTRVRKFSVNPQVCCLVVRSFILFCSMGTGHLLCPRPVLDIRGSGRGPIASPTAACVHTVPPARTVFVKSLVLVTSKW